MEGKRENRAIWEEIAYSFWLVSFFFRRAPPEEWTLTTGPSNITAWGASSESVEAYKQAIILNPSDPRPKFNLAVIYQDQGKLEEAEKLYREIVEQNPGFAPAWSNLASIQEKRGQADEAEKSHRRAMEADRDGCAAASQFGYFLLRARRRDEAARGLRTIHKERSPLRERLVWPRADCRGKRRSAGRPCEAMIEPRSIIHPIWKPACDLPKS